MFACTSPMSSVAELKSKEIYSEPVVGTSIPTKTIIHYDDDTAREYDLVEMKYIDRIWDAHRAFLLFGAKPCVECDAPRSIYMLDPTDDNLRQGIRHYQYPGVISEFDTGLVVRNIRAFVGNCLNNSDRVFIHITQHNGKEMQTFMESQLVSTINGHLTETQLQPKFDFLSLNKRFKFPPSCKEIPPINRQAEP